MYDELEKYEDNLWKKSKRKAVILCGGRGSRMMPLTASTPKPCLSVGGEAVIIHLLKMLKNRGINSVCLTVGYMGRELEEFVRSHPDVNDMELLFLYESTPLGSGGGVKKAEDFLDCDFMVLCGDAWCEFDVNAPFELLSEKNCHGVIMTAKCDIPLDYGLVICDDFGRVKGFDEKPSWSAISTERVNTGIYVFKKDVLSLMDREKWDFAKDLFPKMLAEKYSLYSLDIDGEWSDIGDPDAYYTANMKVTQGKNAVSDGVVISKSADVKKSILLSGCRIMDDCKIEGAIIGKKTVIGKGSVIMPHSVIGEECTIEEDCYLGEGVFLPEKSRIRKGERLENPLLGEKLLENRRVRIICDDRISNKINGLGMTLSSIVPVGGVIGIMWEDDRCKMWADKLISCLEDKKVVCLENGGMALTRYFARSKQAELTIYARYVEKREKEAYVELLFFDENGVYPGAEFERKLKSAMKWAKSKDAKPPEEVVKEDYSPSFINWLSSHFSKEKPSFNIEYVGQSNDFKYLDSISDAKQKEYLFRVIAKDGNISSLEYGDIIFDKRMLLCSAILYYLKKGVTEIPLAYRTPRAVKEFVKNNGARLYLYSVCAYCNRDNTAKDSLRRLPALEDMFLAAVCTIAYIVENALSPMSLRALLPDFYCAEGNYEGENNLSKLIHGGFCHDGEGFLLAGGRIRVVPEDEKIWLMTAEAASEFSAKEMLRKAMKYFEEL